MFNKFVLSLTNDAIIMYQVKVTWYVTDKSGEVSLDLEFVHYGDARRQYDEWIAKYAVVIANADGHKFDARMCVTLHQDNDLYCQFEAKAD